MAIWMARLSSGLAYNSTPVQRQKPLLSPVSISLFHVTREWLLRCFACIFTTVSSMKGCDASVLLDDNEDLVGEKTAAPNVNSLRGFEVIDSIKREVEYLCPETVSCADILAVAARDSVVLSGGPSWEVEMGRKDSLRSDKEAANNNIPSPNSTVSNIVVKFQNLGLTLRDMVAVSGAHTIGKARCASFESRLKESISRAPNGGLEGLRETLKILCLESDGDEATGNLDLTTPAAFDNQYYINLLNGEGLLESEQEVWDS